MKLLRVAPTAIIILLWVGEVAVSGLTWLGAVGLSAATGRLEKAISPRKHTS